MIFLDHDELWLRLLATKAVQEKIVAEWTWEEKPATGWAQVQTAMTQAKSMVDQSEASLTLLDGAVTQAQAALHARTKQVVGLAKLRFRNEPVKAKAFEGLRAVGTTVSLTRSSADDLAAAWAKADATGSYVNTTLADYNALRTALDTAQTNRESGRTGVKQAKKSQQSVLKSVKGDLVAWYAAATRVFPDNTATGALIRAEIPT